MKRKDPVKEEGLTLIELLWYIAEEHNRAVGKRDYVRSDHPLDLMFTEIQ
jgi:hypothetical protein